MKRLAGFLLGLLLVSPALAAGPYYFSDCGYDPRDATSLPFLAGALCDHSVDDSISCTTCSGTYPTRYCYERVDCIPFEGTCTALPGTETNPYCLDPGGDGIANSLGQLSDGGIGAITDEVAPGDVVYFCAGPCDHTGSATFYLQGTSGSTWLIPQVNGGGSKITLMPYPGETVILSGDSNANGLPDSGDLTTIFDQNAHAKTDWASRGLIYERWAPSNSGEILYLNNNADGWVFDQNEFRFLGQYGWTGQELGNTACSSGSAPHLLKFASLTGTLTWTKNKVHHACIFAHRATVNPAAASVLIAGNEYWNVKVVTNDFQTRNITYRGNYLHDCDQGLNEEEQMVNTIIEDNVISCPGNYKVGSGGRCETGISFSDGDNGAGGTITTGIRIRRNKVFGSVAGAYSGSPSGWFLNPIRIIANTNVALDAVIENNDVWHHWGWANSTLGGIFPDAEWAGPAIYISTNRDEVAIQNNTFYDSKIAVLLHGTTAGRAYSVINNLFSRSRKSSTTYPSLVITGNATASIVANNLFDRTTRSSTTEQIAWVDGAYKTCANAPTFGLAAGSANICANAMFMGCTDTTFSYCALATSLEGTDLRLAGSQPAIDAGVIGAAADIELQPRPYNDSTDIGADEVYPCCHAVTPRVSIPRRPATP